MPEKFDVTGQVEFVGEVEAKPKTGSKSLEDAERPEKTPERPEEKKRMPGDELGLEGNTESKNSPDERNPSDALAQAREAANDTFKE